VVSESIRSDAILTCYMWGSADGYNGVNSPLKSGFLP